MAELNANIPALLTADELAALHALDKVKCLDCTWELPSTNQNLPNGFIPGAQFFDIDIIAQTQSNQKHMLPSSSLFCLTMSDMGITQDDHIVCYDRQGIFSSPRVWWTFKMFGHKNVSILDGGLPAWKNAGYKTKNTPAEPADKSSYSVSPPLSGIATMSEVKSELQTTQIIDARPKGRFYGTQPEPRGRLRSGHIPGSHSVPFGDLRTPDQHFKPLEDIKAIFTNIGLDLDAAIITSCGSGITAAGLAFNLFRLGAKNVRVYDGSWAEWGDDRWSEEQAPIAQA